MTGLEIAIGVGDGTHRERRHGLGVTGPNMGSSAEFGPMSTLQMGAERLWPKIDREIERSSGRSQARNVRAHNGSRKQGRMSAPAPGSSKQRRSAKTNPSRERARLGNARRAFDARCVVPGMRDRAIDWLVGRIRVVPAS